MYRLCNPRLLEDFLDVLLASRLHVALLRPALLIRPRAAEIFFVEPVVDGFCKLLVLFLAFQHGVRLGPPIFVLGSSEKEVTQQIDVIRLLVCAPNLL